MSLSLHGVKNVGVGDINSKSNATGDQSRIICGDCLDALTDVPDNSVDLIVTSPPYADKRKSTYGGIAPDKYVEWFLPRSAEMYRVLKPSGSFILNIKEGVYNGERHLYVYRLVNALVEQGWKWVDDYCWAKSTSFPGKWPNRFRDAWEHCYHFTKATTGFKMNQEDVKEPIGNWAQTRLANLSTTDKARQHSATGSGASRNMSAWVGRTTVFPSNTLRLAPECSNRGHSAAFPVSLTTWFIKIFTDKGDVVLDPFAGSGTTGVACENLRRKSIQIDQLQENCILAEKRWKKEGCNDGK